MSGRREELDPNPMEIPAGFKRPETLAEQIRRLVRSERFNEQMDANENDTFEEAEDFDIEDDMWDPSSPFEEVFDPVLQRGITIDEFRRNEPIYQKRYLEAEAAAYEAMEKSEALRARPKKEPGAGQRPAETSEGPKPDSGKEPPK